MIPIGDDNVKGGPFPIFSYAFIAINVLVFVVIQLPVFNSGEQAITVFFENWAGMPCELSQFEELKTLISSIFLHGGWMHLLGNMVFLWVFADNIESTIGNLQFAVFYLLGGIIATYTHVYLGGSPTDCTPLVGASGAISAVLGAYLVMFPKSKIKLWLFLFSFRMSAMYFLGLWFIQQFTGMGTGELGAEKDQVAYWAHIGGFIFGVLAGLTFRKNTQRVELANGKSEYQTTAYLPKRYNDRFKFMK